MLSKSQFILQFFFDNSTIYLPVETKDNEASSFPELDANNPVVYFFLFCGGWGGGWS